MMAIQAYSWTSCAPTGGLVTFAPHVVVAVPDACIQEMLQMALLVHGYQVACTPIDLLHPFGWIVEARSHQPEAVIIDVDLFRHLSVQESIVAILQAWRSMERRALPIVESVCKDMLGRQAPIWVWLSRRPVAGTAALRMPFHLAQLDAALRGYDRQAGRISLTGISRNGRDSVSHYD